MRNVRSGIPLNLGSFSSASVCVIILTPLPGSYIWFHRYSRNNFSEDFSRTIQEAEKQLLAIPEEAAAAGLRKWSSKQIVGHLIDSAANNHLRFVRAQTINDLMCPGYDQEAWVDAQRYDEESWTNLVQLWSAYNEALVAFHVRYV